MIDTIHKDSLTAWQSLSQIGGLELDGRDKDLATQLKNQIDKNAPNLESALKTISTDLFLHAFFQIIQPFTMMFRDVLEFFQMASAREGQAQWKIKIDNEFFGLQHFVEYLEHWDSIDYEIEFPAIEMESAYILEILLRDSQGNPSHSSEEKSQDGSRTTGIDDVDFWIKEYDEGRYSTYPYSLDPEKLDPGIGDVARIVIAVLSVIQKRGLDKSNLQKNYLDNPYNFERQDIINPLTIARLEAGSWLRKTILNLACLYEKSEIERFQIGTKLECIYKKYPRLRVGAKVKRNNLDKLLSLPIWKKRHEFYGVWVATEIVRSLEGHEFTFYVSNGEFKFPFKETKIFDVISARPQVSLISERRSPLSNPIGTGRKFNVQPDFGIWTCGKQPDKCIMIIEVKHYKKQSRGKFRDVLIDYANAHTMARVILVNYGPVGSTISVLPDTISDRCTMIGYLNPEVRSARMCFQKLVRGCVGGPAVKNFHKRYISQTDIFVIDISISMLEILSSNWFRDFTKKCEGSTAKFALIDTEIRSFETYDTLNQCLSNIKICGLTRLDDPVTRLLENYKRMIVVTDQDGIDNLKNLDGNLYSVCELKFDKVTENQYKLLEVTKLME